MEFISAFLLIFFAEMGDKTQLLALAFSTKYSVKQVLTGVMIGSFLNHGIAILLASFIATLASDGSIKILAALMFIGFGLWSLKLDFVDEEDEDSSKLKLGPIFTVALAFFIGELGDKTQLSAMALGLDSISPFVTLIGTTAGMVAVSGIGILVGRLIGKKIPEVTMKVVSAFVFLGFGVTGLWSSIPGKYLTNINILLFTLSLILAIAMIMYINSVNRNKYFGEKIHSVLSQCKECDFHNPECVIGLEIESITREYFGGNFPYLGKVVVYLESFKVSRPKKYKYVQNWK